MVFYIHFSITLDMLYFNLKTGGGGGGIWSKSAILQRTLKLNQGALILKSNLKHNLISKCMDIVSIKAHSKRK